MSESKFSLADRMKYYESLYNNTFEYNNTYLIRLDGNGFSKRIKQWKLDKPFDSNFHFAMINTCKELINLIPNAKLIWTGSDEITILCMVENKNDAWFGNRINKILSLSASYCSANFNKFMKLVNTDVYNFPGFFDSRIITVPVFEEAVNNILSRYNDCKKNSISMWAESVYSHKELLNKNSNEKITMLLDKNINWYDSTKIYDWTKYGSFIYKQSICFDKETNKEVAVGKAAKELFIKDEEKYYIRNKAQSIDLTAEYSEMLSKIKALLFE